MNHSPAELRLIITRRIFFSQLGLVATFAVLILVSLVWPELLGSFFFGIFLGSLGGSIALMKRIQSESPAILAEIATNVISTLMPLLYGALMAGIAYLLFMSGILSGEGGSGLFTSNLFPNFAAPEKEDGALLSIRTINEMRPTSI